MLAKDVADLVHAVAQVGEHDDARGAAGVGGGRVRLEVRQNHLLQRGHLGVRRRAPHQMVQPRLKLPGSAQRALLALNLLVI